LAWQSIIGFAASVLARSVTDKIETMLRMVRAVMPPDFAAPFIQPNYTSGAKTVSQ